ncbi:MAG: hypothetical protein GC204_13525 [Chloroflexi bacterium]|nr:hypothetical protein [Chloroflexota bacterium]
MITLAPLGMDVVLPAFVVGYEYSTTFIEKAERLSGGKAPDWLVDMDLQVGGYLMSYPRVVGVVLRLEANREKGKADLSDLIRGIKAMAEGGDRKLLKEYPLLDQLAYTYGAPYSAEELKAFENYLSGYMDIPAIKEGLEAYISHVQCNPLDYFNGWNLMRCQVVPEGNPQSYFDEFFMDEIEFYDDEVYGEAIQNLLIEAARDGIFKLPYPRVFLLWENSD